VGWSGLSGLSVGGLLIFTGGRQGVSYLQQQISIGMLH